jgi:predicted transcriptional regulator
VQIKQWSSSLLPSQREMKILEYLWSCKTASARDIHKVFGNLWQVRRQVVHSVLQIMLERGFVERHIEQSRAIYKPALSRADLEQAVIHHVAETFFHGSLYTLWCSLLRHPQFRLALEQAGTSANLNTVRPTN